MIHSAVLPVLGALAHAIANTTGVWITDLPITPEKIFKTIRDKKPLEKSVAVQYTSMTAL